MVYKLSPLSPRCLRAAACQNQGRGHSSHGPCWASGVSLSEVRSQPWGFPGWRGPSCSLSSPSIPGQQSLVVLPSQKQGWKTRGRECVPGRGGQRRTSPGWGNVGSSPSSWSGPEGCLLTVHTLMTSAPIKRVIRHPAHPDPRAPSTPSYRCLQSARG